MRKHLASFNKCLEIDPSNIAAWNNKGATLVEMGRYNDALACYDEAIKQSLKLCHPLVKQGRSSSFIRKELMKHLIAAINPWNSI